MPNDRTLSSKELAPIREEDMRDPGLPNKRILVYRINGDLELLRVARPVWRKPVKFKGRWCVRDHGRVPLRGRIGHIYVT
jgi:hypothetical protein